MISVKCTGHLSCLDVHGCPLYVAVMLHVLSWSILAMMSQE